MANILHKLLGIQSILMYYSVLKVLKNCRLEFFKTKLQNMYHVFICFHQVVIYLQKVASDMLDKNTLGVKKV